MGRGIVTLPPMRQPEAAFKAKLIKLHRDFVGGDPWHTYLSAGGPGQRPGLPDLVFGTAHGVVWVEAKIGARPKLRTLQKKTILALHRYHARVCIPCRDGDHVHLYRPRSDGFIIYARTVTPGPDLWPAIIEATS